jgi:hypothetical protein
LFEDYVESLLMMLALPYRRDVAVGGLEVDFEVSTGDGRRLIFETKAWPKGAAGKRASGALHQLNRISAAAGADEAYLVVPEGAAEESPSDRVVGERDLFRFLSQLRWTSSFEATQPRSEAHAKRIFAAMPFSDRYDDTYFVAMVGAANAVGAVCRRVDLEEYNDDIVARIQELIRESDIVIADLSDASPNVLYEAGYAHALAIETVHISSTPLADLPFDVRNWNTIKYSVGKTHRLKDDLVKRLRAVI